MKNLKNLDKKSFFKGFLHIGIVVVILLSGGYLLRNEMIQKEALSKEYSAAIQQYNVRVGEYLYKIDSISGENASLLKEQLRIENKIDSLSSVQDIINSNYENKIRAIYSATAASHAIWFCEKVDSLKRSAGIPDSIQ